MNIVMLLSIIVFLTSCSSSLTSYVVKTSIGDTREDDGMRSLYTGASLELRFDKNK